MTNPPDELVLDIARRHFLIETIEARNSDRLDFHEVAVWSMADAIREAYRAGANRDLRES